jgi:type I restriction enzyme S subunit
MTNEIKQRIDMINRGEVPHGYKKTKVGIVPSEWKCVKANTLFNNVSVKNQRGNFDVLSSTQDRGVIPRDMLNIDIKYDKESISNYKKIDIGDFVISLRSFQGGIEYSNFEGLVSPAYTVLKNKVNLSKCFYKNYFKSPDYISKLNVAVYGIRDGKQISYDDFGQIQIHFAPLPEQEKITEILTTCDRVIELKEKLIAEKKAQKKWLMQNLLTDKKRLKGFTCEWKKVKLGSLCNIKGGKRLPKGYSLQENNNGYPYITVSDMKNGTVFLNKILYVPNEVISKIQNYKITVDDIYISVAGTLGLVGTIPLELNNANLTENADKLVDIKCNKFYLLCVLNSDIIQRQILDTQTNNAQPKLAIEQIRNFSFLLPEDEEQSAIANILSTADHEIELLQSDLDEWINKKKALMQLLLTGKVRV